MTPAQSPTLTSPVAGLYATPAEVLPFLPSFQARSFVLRREAGDVVVYNAPGLATAGEEITALGPPSLWVVGHEHEAIIGPQELGIGAHVHERDRAASEALPIDGTFTERETLGGDLEVVPIPGHTPGSTAYLWDSGEHRILFPADTLWLDGGGPWRAAVLDSSDRDAYLESLATLRDLEFDVLAPWAGRPGQAAVEFVTPEKARRELDAVIERVAAGASQ